MPPRRRPTLATLATLLSSASTRLRWNVVAGALLSTAAKLLAVLIALRIADGDVRGATIGGVAAVIVLGATRVSSSGARVTAECDLHRATVRALLESDVLVAPTKQPLRALFEPIFYARTLITDTVPELAASALAALVVVPILVTTMPARALAVSAIAVAVVMVALVWASRISSRVQGRVWQEQERVLDRVGFTIESRLELVARGADEDAMKSIEGALDRYRAVARRGAWGAALLGRAPLVAGLAVVVVVVVLDGASREAITAAVLGQALVLAACLPVGLGVVMRSNELLRQSVIVEPVLAVLAAPRRAELERRGAPPPTLPAPIVARDLTFSYGADVEPTLRAVSFEWQPATALLVRGPNGAGKSTLMRLLLGLREAQSGSLTVGGAELSSLDLRALRRSIAYLPQRPYLGEPLSTIRSALRAVRNDADDSVLATALSRVNLTPALSKHHVAALDVPLGELSAGQRQRVALARLLVQEATVYMLDEPDANLDRSGIALVGEIIAELVARGHMVAIAAHTEELTSIAGTHVTLG